MFSTCTGPRTGHLIEAALKVLCERHLDNVPQLLGVQDVSVTPPSRASIAIFLRKKERVTDSRIEYTDDRFLKIVKSILVSVKSKYRVVVLDASPATEMKDILYSECPNEWLDCTEHVKDKSSGKNRNINEQLNYLFHLKVEKNIIAGIGIHGGLMDVMSVLGLHPSRMHRILLPSDPKIDNKKWMGVCNNWKKQTDNLTKLCCGAESVWHFGQESALHALSKLND